MKKLTEIFSVCLVILLCFHNSYAQRKIFTVPFENIILNPSDVINANYTFGPPKAQYNIIFCYDNSLQTLGIITWTYQGTRPQGQLPIYLKTQPLVQGEFADSNGSLSITNNQRFPLVISCQYAL